MAIDTTSLSLKIQSTGIDEATASLINLVAATKDADKATTNFTVSVKTEGEAVKETVSAGEAYLQKLQIRADTIGKTSEFTAGYIAKVKELTDSEVSVAEGLGAQVDAYKNLSVAQTQAIKDNKALDDSYKQLEKDAAAFYAASAKSSEKAFNKEVLKYEAEQLKAVADAERALATESKNLAAAESIAAKNKEDLNKAQERGNTLNAQGSRANELAKITAAEKEASTAADMLIAAENKTIKVNQDLNNSYDVMMAKIKGTRGDVLALQAAQQGASAETIATAKATGDAVQEAAEKGEHATTKWGLGTVRANREVAVLGHEIISGNFSRIPGSLMVLGESINGVAIKAALAYIPVAALVLAVAGIGMAVHSGIEEYKDLNRAIDNTGNFSGKSAHEVQSMGEALASSNRTVHDTQMAMMQLVESGRIEEKQLQNVGAAAVSMAKAHNTSVQEAAKELEKFAGDSGRFLSEYNSHWHVLTVQQYEAIHAAQLVGDEAKAYEIELDAVRTKGNEVAKSQEAMLGTMARGWNSVRDTISGVVHMIGQIGVPDSVGVQIATIDDQINKLTTSLKANKSSWFANDYNEDAAGKRQLAQLELTRKNLMEQFKTQESKAKLDHDGVVQEQATEKARKYIDDAKVGKVLKQREALMEEDKQFKAAILNLNTNSKEYIEALQTHQEKVEAINKRAEVKVSRGPANDLLRAQIAKDQGVIDRQQVEQQGVILANEGKLKANEISKAQMVKANGEAAIAMWKNIEAEYTHMAQVVSKSPQHKGEEQGLENKALKAHQEQIKEQQKIDEAYYAQLGDMESKAATNEEKADSLRGKSSEKTALQIEEINRKQLKEAEDAIQVADKAIEGFDSKTSAATENLFYHMKLVGEELKRSLQDLPVAKAEKDLEELQKKVDKITQEFKKSNPMLALMGDKKSSESAMNDQLKVIKDGVKAAILTEQQGATMIAQIKYDALLKTTAAQSASDQLALTSAQTVATGIANIASTAAGKKSAAAKVALDVEKGFAIASASLAIHNALGEAMVAPTFPLAMAQYAIVATQGAAIISDISSIKTTGFSAGGYTGDMGTSDVAGVVHGQEYVVNAAATARNRDVLEAMNSGAVVNSTTTAGNNSSTAPASASGNVHVHNYGAVIEVEKRSDGDIAIIARREAKGVVQTHAGDIVANHLGNANSSVSKALQRSTQTARRRT